MPVLGIESTAHTFGAGVVDRRGRVLSDVRASFSPPQGGLHPRAAADHHYAHAVPVLARALGKASVSMDAVDAVAFALGPGMGPCLRVGALCARALALAHDLPLVAVNHAIAHIEYGKALTGARDPLVVYASGGNTQLLALCRGRYRVYGETLDIGLGNLLDVFGRRLGLGFPAGPVLDAWYQKGRRLVSLPYSVKGTDLVFSGLLTAATQKIGSCPKKDLAFSLLHHAFAMLCEAAERALAATGRDELLLTGGVGASKSLQAMLGEMCRARGARFCPTPAHACTDNGAMIAYNGWQQHRAGRHAAVSATLPRQRWRADQVPVTW